MVERELARSDPEPHLRGPMLRLLRFPTLHAFALFLGLAASCQAPWRELPLDEEHWQSVSFGGEGEVEFGADGVLMRFGSPLTGVRWTGDELPAAYEIEVRAVRLDGNDFFCGLNLPIGPDAATVVLGGWGGALCGLSCIDGMDASMNATRSFQNFERGRAHLLRVRVDGRQVAATVDGIELFQHTRGEGALSLRTEVEPVGRLGLTCFQTSARIEAVRWRPLTAR